MWRERILWLIPVIAIAAMVRESMVRDPGVAMGIAMGLIAMILLVAVKGDKNLR